MSVTARRHVGAAATGHSRVDQSLRDSLIVAAVSALSVTLAVAYALMVQPGSAYDEPAHFSNVLFYGQHAALPVLGQPGVSYEGQQPPLYYLLAALALRAANGAGAHAGFYAVRLAGLTLLPIAIVLTRAIVREAVADRSRAWILATLLVACNPALLAIAASVQNDMLNIVLTFAVILLLLRWTRRGPIDARRAAALGLLVAAALLTKLTGLYLVVTVPAAIWLVSRNSARRAVPVFAAVVVLAAGWWFVRNLVVYGDPTGTVASTHHYGTHGTGTPLWHLAALGHWLYSLAGQYWFPSEYYRNVFSVPWLLRGLVAAVTLSAVAGLVVVWRAHPAGFQLSRRVCLVLVVQLLGAIAFAAALAGSPRYTFGTYAITATLVGISCGALVSRLRIAPSLAPLTVTAVLLAGNGFVLDRMRDGAAHLLIQ